MSDFKKQNQLTYLKFFFGILRFKMFLVILLNIAIGFLDGIGLTMLILLLQSVDGGNDEKKSRGQLWHFISILEYLGLTITVTVILLVFLSVFIIKAIIKYTAARYQNKVQQLFVRKIQMDFTTSIRKMSYRGFLQLDAGNIQNTI